MKRTDVLLGFLLKSVTSPSCFFPSSQFMVNNVINEVNTLRVVLMLDISHKDTAIFPGQRYGSCCYPFFLKVSLRRSEEVPAEGMAQILYHLLTFSGHYKSLLTFLHFSFSVITTAFYNMEKFCGKHFKDCGRYHTRGSKNIQVPNNFVHLFFICESKTS